MTTVPVVLRISCPGCGASPGVCCDGGPPVCAERMNAAQDEFEAQYRSLMHSVDGGDEWDEPTRKVLT